MIRALATLVSLVVLAFVPARAQEAGAPSIDQEMMERWTAYMTPGEPHDYLADQTGTWRYDMKLWMDPSAPPVETSGTMTSSMMLGGRYQEQSFEGTFMGMPFEGYSITGYDNAEEEFFNVWIDNMGTGMLETRGTYDSDVGILELVGTYDDPMTGAEGLRMRTVTRAVDDEHMVHEMYMKGSDGREVLTMELHAYRETDG